MKVRNSFNWLLIQLIICWEQDNNIDVSRYITKIGMGSGVESHFYGHVGTSN